MPVLASMLVGCGLPRYRPGDLPKNLASNLNLDGARFLPVPALPWALPSSAQHARQTTEAMWIWGRGRPNRRSRLGSGRLWWWKSPIVHRVAAAGCNGAWCLRPVPACGITLIVDSMYDFRVYELTRTGKRALPAGEIC